MTTALKNSLQDRTCPLQTRILWISQCPDPQGVFLQTGKA